MPKQDTTPEPEGAGPAAETTPRPAYRVGDEIVFKYEGNLRARVAGFEEVGGRVWLDARASLRFLVPPSLVVGVEGEDRQS